MRPRGRLIDRAGRALVNLSSNDYLGLASHPHLVGAAAEAIGQFGTGATASRLAGGHFTIHQTAERRFAAFKLAPAGLLFPTGYMANLAVLSVLVTRGDWVLADKLSHASLLDSARASGATLRVFGHRNYDRLSCLLKRWAAARAVSPRGPEARRPRCVLVTDSVFSMDGDVADLPRMCDLARQYGAILLVDEAHGTGVLGQRGTGLCEQQNVMDQVDVVVSTASKALGGQGGIVTGPEPLIETLVNSARAFLYSTGIAPSGAATLCAALDVVEREPQRRWRLRDLGATVRSRVRDLDTSALPMDRTVPDAPADQPPTPIVPIVVGSAAAALDLSRHLESQGLWAPAIRPPSVAPGASRVRISLRADHTDDDVDQLLDALRTWKRPMH